MSRKIKLNALHVVRRRSSSDELACTNGRVKYTSRHLSFYLFMVRIDHVCLSIYYLLIVKFEVTEDSMKSYVEPIMHATALLVGFGTGIASVVLDTFNNSTLWCWIAEYPQNCQEEGTCVRGNNASVYRLTFFYLPLWLSMLSVLGINLCIYRTVRRRELKAVKLHNIHHKKHGRPSQQNTWLAVKGKQEREMDDKQKTPSFMITRPVANLFRMRSDHRGTEDIGSNRTDSSVRQSGPVLAPIKDDIETENLRNIKKNCDQNLDEEKYTNFSHVASDKKDSKTNSIRVSDLARDDSNHSIRTTSNKGEFDNSKEIGNASFPMIPRALLSLFNTSDSLDATSRAAIMILPEKFARRISRKFHPDKEQTDSPDPNNKNSVRSVDVRHVLETIGDYSSAARQYAATYHIGARLVVYQSIAYVLGFWMIWLLPTINRAIQSFTNENQYWLLVCQALFEPLQGLFNVFVYRFAQYVRLKQLHPQWTTRQLLRNTLRFTFLGPSNDARANERPVLEDNDPCASDGDENVSNVSVQNSSVRSRSMPVISEASSQSDDSGQIGSSNFQSRSFEDYEDIFKQPGFDRRASSMMGDLIGDFADDPSMLNGNFLEIGNSEVFSAFPYQSSLSYSASIPPAFPTIKSSFSRLPSRTEYPTPEMSAESQTSITTPDYEESCVDHGDTSDNTKLAVEHEDTEAEA